MINSFNVKFLGLVLGIGLFAGIAGLASAQTLAGPVAATPNVSIPVPDGISLRGYVAVPVGKGPFPAVIMIHEWWGLTVDITEKADRLSKEGFVVLAPDLYRGRVATVQAEAQAQNRETPAAQIAADLDKAFLWLAARPDVDIKRMGSTGFCFGGRQSMNLGTRQTGLKAIVTLYGSGLLQTEADFGVLGKQAPVLGIFGADDKSIPPEQRAGFKKVLTDRKVNYTETVYPGVGHAFVKSDNIDVAGPAKDAWNQMVAFFKKQLM